MNIGAINTQIQLKNYIGLAKTASFKSLNSVDTFEKTTVPKSLNEAINWLEQTDFINTRLSETLNNDDNISGEGFSHIVYAIPGNEEYILRMKKSNVLKGQIKSSEIKDVEDKNLKVNIGQPVAEIVYETEDSPGQGRIEVLKKQTGEPVGVKPPSAIYIEDTDKLRENELPYEDISRKEAYARTIHKVAELPVEAYEKFLEDITSASKSGYKFDYYNSNNILVDDKGQALNLIDMDKCSMDADYGSILYALTNIESQLDGISQEMQGELTQSKKSELQQRLSNLETQYLQSELDYLEGVKEAGESFDFMEGEYDISDAETFIPAYAEQTGKLAQGDMDAWETDGQEGISLEEYKAAQLNDPNLKEAGEEEYEAAAQYVNEIFQGIDVDGDGVLEKNELQGFYAALDNIDGSVDGKLSYQAIGADYTSEKFQRNIREFQDFL